MFFHLPLVRFVEDATATVFSHLFPAQKVSIFSFASLTTFLAKKKKNKLVVVSLQFTQAPLYFVGRYLYLCLT